MRSISTRPPVAVKVASSQIDSKSVETAKNKVLVCGTNPEKRVFSTLGSTGPPPAELLRCPASLDQLIASSDVRIDSPNL